ncbi:Ca2+-transporting P-type ATPase [Suhomyces tanzawaensis NRRL Y-17324]|uniref:Calcium-transporting ATPase n=1 Tax=Suhomyces tanzawaensis NRRL Y-17324 TaxID=984487 RepID=A0A1E4SB74_9ASCO|nr:Ca2+-transporting P-type ATPase [Suhomyces tanzawaensis NRRL Y-17324]ODV76753.1 Ca2+-transporting P-type ATPase [Suhomyces tanzawaensis NRRL Y-17324]
MAPQTPADRAVTALTLRPDTTNVDAASVNSATPLNDNSDELTHEPAPLAAIKQTFTGLTTSASRKTAHQFAITPASLTELHDPKSLRALYNIGGFSKLQALLQVNADTGLDDSDKHDAESRLAFFGANRLPTKSQKSFLRLCFEAMKDKVLILLSVAAVVSLALGLYETFGEETFYDDEHKPLPKIDYVEGVAILVAIFIVVIVGAANDYQKERQFAKLNAKKTDRDIIVIRGGQQKLISIHDLLVGDIINLQTGDVVPSDCILFNGEIECDESALTGESATIKKAPVKLALEYYELQLPTDEDLGSAKIKFKDPYLISGSKVLEGLGNAIVTAVGKNSIHGRTMLSLNTEAETTPLQERLDNLAEGISKYGFLAALVLFVVLLIRFGVNIAPGGRFADYVPAEKGKVFMDILITAITIVVVAVPEGLPLAVTLALAFATTRMAQNGNLVRVLKACETMGGATTICSDKTGTLTENRMRIVRGFFGLQNEGPLSFDDSVGSEGVKSTEILDKIDPNLKIFLCTNISLNSTAFENSEYDEEKAHLAKQKPKQVPFLKQLFQSHDQIQQQMELGTVIEPYVGNKTESALLILANDLFNLFGSKTLEQHRHDNLANIVQIIPFESSRKWSGIVMKIENGFRLYVKGAAEIVFKNCGYQFNTEGQSIAMDRTLRDKCLNCIDEYANDALRAIALGHRDFVGLESWPPKELAYADNESEADPKLLVQDKGFSSNTQDRPLTLDSIVGIQDPLKEGVPEAVLQCQKAGVSVRMVTGDNLITAKAISKSCYILTPNDLSNEFAFMEGPAFRKLSPKERARIAPDLKVLARSSPEDKRILVDTLRKAGEVVAVTGDGTNDAPALKLADIGFSMGISGTEVAREASDIILMTDDFNDIVQAIKWGRTVAISIKKFIQFQLTVNITACVLTFVSAVASSENKSVLTAVQLLWVNLIMDTLAALALATDKPDDSFLNRKPLGRHAPLISTSMWKMIIGQSATQLIITFILHFEGSQLFFGDRHISNHESQQMNALTFNTFVWLQFWKLVVTRKLDEADDINTVRGRITRENLDFFQHLFRNWYFITIALIIAGCQILIMFVGGAAFSIARQTPAQWATAIVCGWLSIPAGLIIRIIPNWWVEKIFPTRAFNKFIYYAGFNFLKKKKKADEELEEEPNTIYDNVHD